MHDDDGHASPAPALVATTLLTAVVGVGAVIYNRSTVNLKMGNMLGALGLGSHAPAIEMEPEITVEEKSKPTRSKERRRRGKDPLKEMLKGNKKAKAKLDKVLASNYLTVTVPDRHNEPDTPVSDYASTSRSVSTASSSRRELADSSVSSVNGDDDEESDHRVVDDDDDEDLTPPAADSASTASVPSLAESFSTASVSSLTTDSENSPQPAFISHDVLQPPSVSKQKQPTATSGRRSKPKPSPSLLAMALPLSRPPSRPSSTHPSSRSSTPPPATQLASLRGALEASRSREESARRDIERYGKEIEMMRWERDALRAQVCQMQAYLSALLASPPPFTPYNINPTPPTWYPPPHMQSPFASPGGSPASRGRRGRTEEVEEEDEEVSEALADAILKRPSAMFGTRSTPQSPTAQSSSGSSRSADHSPPPPEKPVIEQLDAEQELTFPSLYPSTATPS